MFLDYIPNLGPAVSPVTPSLPSLRSIHFFFPPVPCFPQPQAEHRGLDTDLEIGKPRTRCLGVSSSQMPGWDWK